jgi:hypothetical protein
MIIKGGLVQTEYLFDLTKLHNKLEKKRSTVLACMPDIFKIPE